MQTILVKYLCATQSKGSRIKARGRGRSVTVPYSHEKSAEQNFDDALRALVTRLGLWGSWIRGELDGGGKVYTLMKHFDPMMPDALRTPHPLSCDSWSVVVVLPGQ